MSRVSDTHHDFTRFSTKNFPEQKDLSREDRVIICGDFGGIWSGSNEDEWWLNWLGEKNFTICFVDGNHENYDLLKLYPVVNYCGGKAHKIKDNIYHLMRGEIFEFEGKKFFCFGGAKSHDIDGGIFEPDQKLEIAIAYKQWMVGTGSAFRVNHVSWWKDEIPSEEEMNYGIRNLEAHEWNVDYVITHDLPIGILKTRWWHMDADPLNIYLNMVMERLNFTQWWAGHHHVEERIMGKFNITYEKITRVI